MDNYAWFELTANYSWNSYETDYNVSSTKCKPEINSGNSIFHISEMIYDSVIDSVSVSLVISKINDDTFTPEALSKLWMIPIDIARNTIKETTFSSIRTNEGKISRRFRTDTYQRKYKRLGGSNDRFYTDTLFSKVKRITGETCAQLYTNRVGFTKLYPLITESKAHESLTTFIHEVGIPHELHSDN